MKILTISGALRKGSTNTALLQTVKKLAPEGMEIEIVTLHGIPLYDGDAETEKGKPESVAKLQERIRAADAIIIATPEYNFSIPGVLKNATDWLSRDGNPFKWKRVGVMGASGGPIGTARVAVSFAPEFAGFGGDCDAKTGGFRHQFGLQIRQKWRFERRADPQSDRNLAQAFQGMG